MSKKKDIAQLDIWFPFAGACALCGHTDRRHRLWDAIMDRWEAGESLASIADDYGKPAEAIEAVLRIWPYRRRR